MRGTGKADALETHSSCWVVSNEAGVSFNWSKPMVPSHYAPLILLALSLRLSFLSKVPPFIKAPSLQVRGEFPVQTTPR